MKTCLLQFVVIALFTAEAVAENCTTPNNEEAECISLYFCPVLTGALATHDDASIEFVRKSNCGGTALEPMVCCGSLSNFSTPNSVERSSKDVKNELLPDRGYCGYQHSDDYPSTINITGINEFPWSAALRYDTEVTNETEIKCSGSLISNKYVLTAAHCVLGVRVTVRLGEYNVKNQTDCVEERPDWHECSEPPQDFAIAKRIIHPLYQARTKMNDVALLRLERAVVYSEYIRPICLPTPEVKSAEIGDILTTTGWGTTVLGKQTEIKKKLLGRLMSNEECITARKKETFDFYATENNFCTIELDSATEHTCSGDSGGPVMISRRNQWQQEGIVSSGAGCHTGFPKVSMKVAKYLDWIKENMES